MHRFGAIRILDIFNACLTNLKSDQILFNKISHWFIVTTKLFTEYNIHIQMVQLKLLHSKGTSLCLPTLKGNLHSKQAQYHFAAQWYFKLKF
jgi:hypothetical protein